LDLPLQPGRGQDPWLQPAALHHLSDGGRGGASAV